MIDYKAQARAQHEQAESTRKDEHLKRTVAVINRAPVASGIAEFALSLTGDEAKRFTDLARFVLRLEVQTGEFVRSIDDVAGVLGLPPFKPNPFQE